MSQAIDSVAASVGPVPLLVGPDKMTSPAMEDPQLRNSVVSLQPADSGNVDLLITWTLDPIAEGQYKRVPSLSREELRLLFLSDPERSTS